jgi:hypothetical protein
MADPKRQSMDGKIQPGDVVVSHVNGTRDFYIIATVLSTVGDLTLHGISTMTGRHAAILGGYERQKGDQAVWLFDGSAAAYVRAPSAEWLGRCNRPKAATPESVLHDDAPEPAVGVERECSGENARLAR